MRDSVNCVHGELEKRMKTKAPVTSFWSWTDGSSVWYARDKAHSTHDYVMLVQRMCPLLWEDTRILRGSRICLV